MTSQKSAAKQASAGFPQVSLWNLMREDFRHKTWLLALSILGNLLAGPLAFIFEFTTAYEGMKVIGDKVYSTATGKSAAISAADWYAMRMSECSYMLTGNKFLSVSIIMICMALVAGLTSFRYLYSKKMVDLYHSAPVSRRKLFCVSWLSGLIVWLLPFLICQSLTLLSAGVLMDGTYLESIAILLLENTILMVLCYFIIYHTCLVATMLCGNILNAVVLSFSYGFMVFGLVAGRILLSSAFLDCFYLPHNLKYRNPFYILSPFYSALLLLNDRYNKTPLSMNIWLMISCGAVALFNLHFASFLYQKRRSELSERGLDNRPMRILTRMFLSVLGGYCAALLCNELAPTNGTIWLLLGSIAGCAFTFCVLNIIFHLNLRAVLYHKLQFVVTMAICLVSILAIIFDLTGYDRRLPNKNEITGLSFYCDELNNTDFNLKKGENGLIQMPYLAEPAEDLVFRNSEQIHELLSVLVANDYNDIYQNFYPIIVKVYTGLGSYYRRYLLTPDQFQYLKPFVESEEYLRTYYPGKMLELGNPVSISIQSEYQSVEKISNERIPQLMEAFHQDFLDNCSLEKQFTTSRYLCLDMCYPNADKNEAPIYLDYWIPYYYTRTLSLINAWYPDMNWDHLPEQEKELNIYFSIPYREDISVRDAIYRYYGYQPDGTPITSKEELQQIAGVESYYFDAEQTLSVDFYVTDPELLTEMSENILWSLYDSPLDPQYVHLGAGYHEMSSDLCYIRYGTLPLSLIEEMLDYVTIY